MPPIPLLICAGNDMAVLEKEQLHLA